MSGGRQYIYGQQPVAEAQRGRRHVHQVWRAPETGNHRLEEMAGSPDHQGIVAEVDPFPYGDPNALLDPAEGLIVVLDQIQDLLGPSGSLLVSVPNFGHWYPRLRTAVGRFDYDKRGILDREVDRTVRALQRHGLVRRVDRQLNFVPAGFMITTDHFVFIVGDDAVFCFSGSDFPAADN